MGYQPLNRPGYMCYQVCLFNLSRGETLISNLANTCEKKDENGYYLAINGKKYPLPNNKDWKTLLEINYDFKKYIQTEIMGNYDPYPGIVASGFTGGVHVYICNSCGYQYHLISLPTFIHRDMSKDGIIDEINEKKENDIIN